MTAPKLKPRAKPPSEDQLQTDAPFFMGLPVVEARGDILVKPTRRDIASALRHDPENCAFANCIKRMMETPRVYVYTTVCYVENLDEAGNPIMERYTIADHAHAYITAFDKGQPVAPGGFYLRKPTPGKTLKHKREASRAWAHRNPEKSRALAKKSYQRKKARAKASPFQTTGSFRSGTGMVKFIGTYNGKLATHSSPS